MIKVFYYCEKCGNIMEQRIKYNCGYPIVEYYCSIHGKEDVKTIYSNKTEYNNFNFKNNTNCEL